MTRKVTGVGSNIAVWDGEQIKIGPDAGVGALLAIPVVGSFEFLSCLGVER
jgi:hypothetical protein